jgi:hypothetical protein
VTQVALTSSVFISYRREVGALWALALYQQLIAHDVDAFYDIESLREAGPFNQKLLNQIESRPYFLIVLTPGTLDRCQEPGDWLRREIEHAVSTLFTPRFEFADVERFLPPVAADTVRGFSGLELNPTWFTEAINRLTRELLKQVDVASSAVSAEDIEHECAHLIWPHLGR